MFLKTIGRTFKKHAGAYPLKVASKKIDTQDLP